MAGTYGTSVDKKLIAVMIIVCLALGGGFALIYLDLKADFAILRNKNADLLAQIEQLQGLIEAFNFNQTANLTAVQIYNRTRYSVVLITSTLANGSEVSGSGFIYDTQGHIVTNNHVVSDASTITVTFFDGTTAQAQLTGTDVYSDLAAIKVELSPAQSHLLILGNSTQLMVGEPVYAIGNPFGLSGSMTAGIVSQVGRILRLSDLGVPDPWGRYAIVDVIQIDAAINPGNSGGPLLNSVGEVVGVTFAIETADNVRAFIGIGYVIPSVIVKRVASSIIDTGKYIHPWLGINYASQYVGGLFIALVEPNSPAKRAGLQDNDIITEVDGIPVNRAEDLIIYLERYKSPGEIITLRVVRNNKTLENPVQLELGERPT